MANPLFSLERAGHDQPVRWWSILGVLLVPILVTLGFLGATWNSQQRLHRVEAAVVNQDEMVELNGQKVPLGRQLAAGLTERRDDNFRWVLADEANARDGLKSGRYAAVITIPKEFSANATSYAGDADRAKRATIGVETSQVVGVADAGIAQVIADTARTELNTTLTETYLDNVYLGFNKSGEQFKELADGTRKLADGGSGLADGLGQSRDGARQLADGQRSLADGVGQTATGAGRLADGLDQAYRGGQQLKTGADTAASGAEQLAANGPRLAGGVEQMATALEQQAAGAPEQSQRVKQLRAAGPELSGGVQKLEDGLQQLKKNAPAVQAGAVGLGDGAVGLGSGAVDLGDGLKRSVDGTAKLVDGVGRFGKGTSELASGTKEYADGVGSFVGGVTKFNDGVDSYTNGVQQFDTGLQRYLGVISSGQYDQMTDAQKTAFRQRASQLASGSKQLSDQGKTLRSNGKTLTQGGAALPAGGQKLAAGAQELNRAAAPLRAGVDELRPGVGKLQQGAAGFQQGAVKYRAGAEEYRGGTGLFFGGIAGSADGASGLSGGLTQYVAGVNQLADGLIGQLDGLPAQATGVRELANGTKAYTEGVGQLAPGVRALSNGVGQYVGGIGTAASGAGQLADGINTGLKPGAEKLGEGGGQLADGLNQAADGGRKLADGQRELADGVAEGAEQVPHYSDTQRAKLKGVVAAPVAGNGTPELISQATATSLLMVLALWLGGLATYLVVRAVAARVLTSRRPTWQLAARAIAPGIAIAAVQALLLTVVGQRVLGLSPGRTAGVLALMLLGGAMFAVLNHALAAWWGGVGRLVSVAVVTLTAAAGLTSAVPGFFDTVVPFLPLTPLLQAIRSVMTDGGSVAGAVGVTVLWLLVGLGASIAAVARRRVTPVLTPRTKAA